MFEVYRDASCFLFPLVVFNLPSLSFLVFGVLGSSGFFRGKGGSLDVILGRSFGGNKHQPKQA